MSTNLHHIAAKGFDSQTDSYEKARPTYPNEAVEFVVKELLQSPAKDKVLVVEFGAGTGKFTRKLLGLSPQLAPNSKLKLVAVEPVAGMRTKFKQVFPQAIVLEKGVCPSSLDVELLLLEGTADNASSIESGTVDAIVAAQAFHWFAHLESLREFHRLLRPGGHLILIWNKMEGTKDSESWAKLLHDMADRFSQEEDPKYTSGKWKEVFETPEAKQLFDLPYRSHHFVHYQENMDLQTIWQRIESRSFVSIQTEEIRAAFRKEIESFLKEKIPETFGEGGSGVISFPYITDLVFCQRK